jgi:transcriptional regulator with GAF, ATPase, and Fis domain
MLKGILTELAGEKAAHNDGSINIIHGFDTYPGNLREMKSVVDYIDIVAADVASPEHLPPSFSRVQNATADQLPTATAPQTAMPEIEPAGRTLKDMARAFEERIINEALDRLGSKRAAAKELGVDIATIVRKTNRPSD